MYVSLLFWLSLVLPGYVLVRTLSPEDLKSGLLGTVGLSYFAILAFLSPISIVCYLLRAPLAVFSAACVLALLAAIIECTRRRWWPDLGRLLVGGLSVGLLILVADLVMSALTGSNAGGDSPVHLARIRSLIDHGFNNQDPFVSGGHFFPIYHTNILHALYAACSQLTGVDHVRAWFLGLVWSKLLIAGGAYYLTWCVFGRRGVAWVAAAFMIGCQGPVSFIVYPNKIAPYWLVPMMMGFVVQALTSGANRRHAVKLLAGSLLLGQVHSLYGAFAAILLGPLLAAATVRALWRKAADRLALACCTLALAGAIPFLAVSWVKSVPPTAAVRAADGNVAAKDAAATPAPRRRGGPFKRYDNGRIALRPQYGWVLPRGVRNSLLAGCLAAGITLGLVGPRRKQVGVVLAITATGAVILFTPPLCTLLLQALRKEWVVGRMAFVLFIGYLALVPASLALAVESRLKRVGSRWRQLGVLLAIAAVGAVLLYTPSTRTPLLDLVQKEPIIGRMATVLVVGYLALLPIALVFSIESRLGRWWVSSLLAIASFVAAVPYASKRPPYDWSSYKDAVLRPAERRYAFLTRTDMISDFCRQHIPRGVTVLAEDYTAMSLVSIHDCHVVAPRRGSNGVTDLAKRRRDLQELLAADTPWNRRRSLLRKYKIEYFFPARSPLGWTRGRIKEAYRFSTRSGLFRLRVD